MRRRYSLPLLVVNVALGAEIVALTPLPTPAVVGGLIGVFVCSAAMWTWPYWWPHRASHDRRAGAVWWTLRHPRRRWWMMRHGQAIAQAYEAEKQAEWEAIKPKGEPQRKPLPPRGQMDRAMQEHEASQRLRVKEPISYVSCLRDSIPLPDNVWDKLLARMTPEPRFSKGDERRAPSFLPGARIWVELSIEQCLAVERQANGPIQKKPAAHDGWYLNSWQLAGIVQMREGDRVLVQIRDANNPLWVDADMCTVRRWRFRGALGLPRGKR